MSRTDYYTRSQRNPPEHLPTLSGSADLILTSLKVWKRPFVRTIPRGGLRTRSFSSFSLSLPPLSPIFVISHWYFRQQTHYEKIFVFPSFILFVVMRLRRKYFPQWKSTFISSFRWKLQVLRLSFPLSFAIFAKSQTFSGQKANPKFPAPFHNLKGAKFCALLFAFQFDFALRFRLPCERQRFEEKKIGPCRKGPF